MIVIDPGHGGRDPGAIGNGIIEKDLVLKMSLYMANRLRELGIPFAMTRDTDETLSLTERTRRINEAFGRFPSVIMISNHINASTSTAATGAEVFYPLRNTPDLAQMILNEIGNTSMPVRSVLQRALPNNPNLDFFYIFRNSVPIQSVLVEYGFLTNVSDALRLKTNWENLAEATIKGLMNYLGINYVPPISGNIIYVVRPGDTLFSIANRHNTTVQSIINLNNLTSDLLQIGQQLIISGAGISPKPPSGNITYIVLPGDTLFSIARQFNTTVNEIIELNKLVNHTLQIGQQLLIPRISIEDPDLNFRVHTVRPGDSLFLIAQKFNTSVEEIMLLNNLTSTLITVGQRLIILPANITTYIYTVMPGDTLFALAIRFNTTVDKIKSLNNLTSDLLQINQQLIIPV